MGDRSGWCPSHYPYSNGGLALDSTFYLARSYVGSIHKLMVLQKEIAAGP